LNEPFALAVRIPYFALLGANLYSELADEYAGAYRLARLLADSTASDTARFFADTKGLAAHLARPPALRALDNERCDRFLSNLLPTPQHMLTVYRGLGNKQSTNAASTVYGRVQGRGSEVSAGNRGYRSGEASGYADDEHPELDEFRGIRCPCADQR
jgi:hypothetical protein